MSETVCPFYRRGDDYCDVGIGHISPHDVTMIIAYCNCRFRDCAKYQELSARFPHLAAGGAHAAPASTPGGPAHAGKPVVPPFRVRWPLPFQLRYTSAYCSTYYSENPTKEENVMTTATVKNRGWTVALAGTGINLALGILYAWSIFKDSIASSIANGDGLFTWDKASINDPYATACLVFAFAMILAGKCQDKFGPRLTAILGGLMVGAGFFWASTSTDYWSWVLGFGVLGGAGIGFGYSAATPPALKWFPPAKTGLIAGIVVSGFGLASVYIAPLSKYLLGAFGIQKAMSFYGVAFAIVVSLLALLISNPPQGYVPEGAAGQKKAAAKSVDFTPSQLFSQSKFYTLWIAFFVGAGAGLMVIGSVAGMAKKSLGEMAFVAVAIMAIGNAAGRIVAGIVSDKIGRANTLVIMFVFQAILMFAAIPVMGSASANAILLVVLATFIGFNYGTNLALFPSFAKDLWGMKHYGVNYGLLFTSWGIGAFVLVRIAEMLKAKTGSFTTSFAVAGVLLLVGAMLSLSLRPRKVEVAVKARAAAGVEDEELALQKAD